MKLTTGTGLALGLVLTVGLLPASAQPKKLNIVLIPGLTTDGFYITMRKGAEEAAKRAGSQPSAVKLAGKAGFFMFLYLEVLDASFSFDGVIGAFAITNDIVLMALGLGIGAMYVRSLTVYLVRQGTLDDYVYLEHGAHYAIGALAVILLVTIQYEINEIITGLIGVVLIGWSFWSSVRRNRALAEAEGDAGTKTEVTSGV